ncbi:MAG: hypothetical protein ACRDA3_03475 [Peptostreptococcaceae bacterium]
MSRRNHITFSILSMIGLWVVIIFLSSAVIRLFYAIARTFIYLVGLLSVLLMVGVFVAIFSYIIYRVILSLTRCKRGCIDKEILISSILKIQFKIIVCLIFLYFSFGIINTLIT